jgi:putative phage-type endonuclease
MNAVAPLPVFDRNAGLGASDAAAAVGVSKWKTPYQLWLEKTGQITGELDEEALTLAMGKALEPVVLAAFTRRTGLSVSRLQEQVVDPNWPARWVTLDGMASDGGMIEAKTAGFADPAEWGDEAENDAVPLQYYLQCQHGFACTGAQFGYVPLIILNRQFRLYRVTRNDAVIAQLTANEQQFWQHVETRTPPAPITLEDAALRWPSDTSGEIVASGEIELAAARLKGLKEDLASLEETIEAESLTIKAFMGSHGTLLPLKGGRPLITWKQAKPSRVLNKDALRAEQPSIYSRYEIERPGSRRFLVK